MIRYCVLLALILLNLSALAKPNNNTIADEAFKKTIKKVVPAITAAGTVDYKSGCATCKQIGQNQNLASLYSADNKKKIALTVLSEDEASSIFNELAARGDIPFGYPMDGCYARAHKMVRLMEEEGIIAGKAFVEGELYVDSRFGEVGWSYHVAPVILVKVGGKIKPYIIDPSIFNKPVPFETWKGKMLQKKEASLKREYFTNRFAYDPDDRDANYTDYQEEQIQDMNYTNQNFSRMLFMYNEQMKGKK